jgi:hypothetical protein
MRGETFVISVALIIIIWSPALPTCMYTIIWSHVHEHPYYYLLPPFRVVHLPFPTFTLLTYKIDHRHTSIQPRPPAINM